MYIFKRPFFDIFMRQLPKYAQITVFTKFQKDLANAILDAIDIDKVVKQRFSMEDCSKDPNNNSLVKPFEKCVTNMKRLLIIDCQPLQTVGFKCNLLD